MYDTDHTDLARVLVADRLREARSLHLAREVRRQQKAAAQADQPTPTPAARQSGRPSGLRSLVHFRHVYG